MLRRHVSAIVICSSYYALMCIILNRLPPQISFLGGKYLYEKRENLAVNNLIKLILNHLYISPILSLLLPEKYLIEHSVSFHVQSENLEIIFAT